VFPNSDTPSDRGASACRHTHDDTENTVELPLHDMEIKSLSHVMPTEAYSMELFPKRNKTNSNLITQRHAIYHFFNTKNATKPVLSMSPNFFYKNRVLKNGSHSTNEEKRKRLLYLVGGSPKRLYTILAGTLNSRLGNTTRKFRTEGSKQAHLGQLRFFQSLYTVAFPSHFRGKQLPLHHNIRLPRVPLPANKIPNAQLHKILKQYYNEVTLNRPGVNRNTGRQYGRYELLNARFPVNAHINAYYHRPSSPPKSNKGNHISPPKSNKGKRISPPKNSGRYIPPHLRPKTNASKR